MNYKGGIMYIGIKESQDKQNFAMGIKLTE
jgi:hypothetical protein